MSLTVEKEAPPLQQDESGAIRVGQSRVLLELVIRAFQDGAAAETIIYCVFIDDLEVIFYSLDLFPEGRKISWVVEQTEHPIQPHSSGRSGSTPGTWYRTVASSIRR